MPCCDDTSVQNKTQFQNGDICRNCIFNQIFLIETFYCHCQRSNKNQNSYASFFNKKLIPYEHISWLAKDHFDIIKEKLALPNNFFHDKQFWPCDGACLSNIILWKWHCTMFWKVDLAGTLGIQILILKNFQNSAKYCWGSDSFHHKILGLPLKRGRGKLHIWDYWILSFV